LLPNCHRYLEAYTAIPALGAVIVPLNTRHTTGEQRAILADCGARLLIADVAFGQRAAELATAVETTLLAPNAYEDLLAATAPAALADDIGEEELAALFYTGGTTGPAKGVMLSHRNLVANAFHMTIGAGYDAADTFLHAAPMFHLADGSSIYALTWRGARHVILPAFEPSAVLATIAREQVTCTILVPTMLAALIEHPAAATTDLRSLRLVLHGGAPIAIALLRRAVATLGCSFIQAYGLTEGSSHIALLPREERLLDDDRARSVGQAAMGVELVVRRPDGTACPPGEVGEVTARGPNITHGYWGKPAETAAALRDGWFWTGDLAYLDAAGYVFLVDRARDMIITGGENVYSAEVEAALCAHPAVRAAAVIGLPDATWGERVHAVIVPRSGAAVDVAALGAFCHERLAGYKCPRSVEVVDRLPLSGAGKVLKRELRARHQVGHAHAEG
jgi:long-chain acyl-CoA synthetase